MATLVKASMTALFVMYFICAVAWPIHVNGKFNRYNAQWEVAWKVKHNEPEAQILYRAEELAHEDTVQLSPLAWWNNWSRDYLAEARSGR